MTIALCGTSMERQVRNQARVLFWVSALLLVTCASMTGTFGWTLGRTLFDKILYTAGFVVADIGGAGLMAVSGTCAANKATKAAVGAMVVAMTAPTSFPAKSNVPSVDIWSRGGGGV